jgi:hypothetical protein
MINVVENIGVLIDESVEIPDIDKEDEFIIQIHDPILNEGITYQLEEAGIILEGPNSKAYFQKLEDEKAAKGKAVWDEAAKRGKDAEDDAADDARKLRGQAEWDAASKRGQAAKAEQDKDTLDRNFDDAQRADAKNIEQDGWRKRSAIEARQAKLDAAGDRAEARGDAREKARDDEFTKAEKAEADLQKYSSDDSLGSVATKDGSVREITKKEAVGLGYTSNKSEESPGFMAAIGAAIKENPLVALGGAVIAAAGGYLIYRYMNSIYRLNKATNYYSKLASSTSDPAKKAKYQQKASMYGSRLESAKAKARENKKDFIGKTKEMQSRYSEMKKSGGDARELAKMEKKLSARNKVLSKIGAI